jgi:hypothetical protein
VKPQLQQIYKCYTGVADIYVYFYERGLQLLHKNGILTFITSNKYMRAGYGAKLRAFLNSSAAVRQLIDFGDAPVFDATAYPSIVVLQKTAQNTDQVRALNWQPETPIAEFESVVHQSSFLIAQKELTADGWRIESPVVLQLLEKLRRAGQPLGEYVQGRFYRGVLTGLNEAFVVDRVTRDRLIAEHPSSTEVLKPFLRGRDVKRWRVDFAEQYLIKIESSENKKYLWSDKNEVEAEAIFEKTYPSIHSHLQKYREKLILRDDQGKYFWELRSCKYWQEFEQPKIIYPDIAQRSEFTYDRDVFYLVNTLYLMPSDKVWLVGLLNSKALFWLYTKISSQIRGNFVRYIAQYVSQLPIATGPQTNQIERLVDQILTSKKKNPNADVLDSDREIDQIVYQLYGLTPEEIKIIEGEKSK